VGSDLGAADARLWYLALIGLIAVQRIGELILSNRHVRALEARGAREVGRKHFPLMVIVHSAFLVSSALEPWVADRHFLPVVGGTALVVLVMAQLIRLWTMRSLGVLWTTRVMAVPGIERVTSGPYRWLRHPVYWVVVAEMAAVPMVLGSWVTATVFGLLHLAVIATRIRVENRVLDAMPIPVDRPGGMSWG